MTFGPKISLKNYTEMVDHSMSPEFSRASYELLGIEDIAVKISLANTELCSATPFIFWFSI